MNTPNYIPANNKKKNPFFFNEKRKERRKKEATIIKMFEGDGVLLIWCWFQTK